LLILPRIDRAAAGEWQRAREKQKQVAEQVALVKIAQLRS
jgi:hypothetical protein